MINQQLRVQIKQLRTVGMTYAEICEELGRNFPKSTLSYICRDVKLPDDYFSRQKVRQQGNLKLARAKALVANSEKLTARYRVIRLKAREVTKLKRGDDYEKICLAMLYIAEGAKYKSYRGLSMGSSDPVILRLYISMLKRCYDKQQTDFRARIQHRDDQDPEKLQRYWAEELDLPPDAFYRPYSDKRTAGRPTRRADYKGVCVISCSGADIQLELDAIARSYERKLWGVSSFG